MQEYSKAIAAAVGLIVILGQRHGLDLTGHTALITEALLALATLAGVYMMRNKPKEQA